MGLTTDEIFDNAIGLLENLQVAVKTESDGGKTITKTELMEIATKFLMKIGVDVLD
jgi:hypothetical protein